MNLREKTMRSITERLCAFCPQTYGIAKRDESGQPVLHVEHSMFPISYMRISITDQDRTVQFDGNDFPADYRLIMDANGEEPAKARLALTQGPSTIIIATGDTTPITGLVFVVANVSNNRCLAINALFSADEGRQMSSILCDTSEELLLHWSVQNQLINAEAEVKRYA